MPKRPSRPARVVLSVSPAVEGLEARRLMAASPGRIGDVLGYLASDFAARPEAQLGRAATRNKPYTLAKRQPNKAIVRTVNDTVLVSAVANARGTKKLVAQLEGIGATITGGAGVFVTAAVPVVSLAAVNALSALQFADAAYAPATHAGRTDNYGVQATQADRGQKQYAVTGQGVTVGILSDSYDRLGGAAAGVASDDLPTGVGVLEEYNGPGATDEGRAMAEVVHDVAPGAAIAFATAFNGQSDFADNILSLAKPTANGGAGAKVVVDDVFYYTEPYFQDGVIAQAVNAAANTYGTSYFSAAGNNARSSYESAYRPVSTNVAGLGAGTYHDFDPGAGVAAYQTLTIPAGATILLGLQWDSPFYSASVAAGGTAGADKSLDVFLTDGSGAVLSQQAASKVGGDAYQILTYTNSNATALTARLAVRNSSGSASPGVLKYVNFGTAVTGDFATNSGTSVGHANATGARGVGAAFYGSTPAFNTSPAVKEAFSSSGGTPVYFDANGTRKPTAEVRNQPDLVAPDGGATTFFGQQETGFDGQFHFFGTSAAAPHAAAVAALLLQAQPTATNTSVYSILQSTALDMATSGFDYDTGYGLIQADKALAAFAGSSLSGQVYRDLNNSGTRDSGDAAVVGQPVFIDVDNDNVIDSGTGTATNATPVTIPDASATFNAPSRVTSSLSTTASDFGGRVTSLTVGLNVTAGDFSDIGLTLITPSGVRIPLLTNLGFLSANSGNGIDLTLSDSANGYISGVYSPGTLTGTYKPQSPLSAAVGENASGQWQLEARDYQNGAAPGVINSWSLNLAYAEPQTSTDGNGNYAFAGLTPSAFFGPYRLRTPAVGGGLVQTQPTTPYALNVLRGTSTPNLDFVFASAAPAATFAASVVDDGTAQRSRVRTVTVRFNGTIPAGNIAAGAFTLTQTSAPAGGGIASWTVNVASVTTPAAGQTNVTLSFAGPALDSGSLADGRYALLIDGSRITDALGRQVDAANTGVAGSSRTVVFHRLAEDLDGSATVDFNDFAVLQTAFNTTAASPGYNAGADVNGSGAVDFNDFAILQTNFGKTV